MVTAIHAGLLTNAKVQRDEFFGLDMVVDCPNVPHDILIPRKTWSKEREHDMTASKLVTLFCENFKRYQDGVRQEVIDAGPAAVMGAKTG